MELKDRLAAIIALLAESNAVIENSREAEGTGFLSFKPERLAEAVLTLNDMKTRGTVLDLGCGNGQFALLAAAAGFPSYGIDINARLVAEAEELHNICVERNLIDKKIVCKFAVGNLFPQRMKEEFRKFVAAHNENEQSMPWEDTADPYAALGIKLSEIDIIYCWSWPTQSRILYNFLADATGQGTLFILPAYERYTQGEHMNASMREPNRLILDPIARIKSPTEIFIGRKV